MKHIHSLLETLTDINLLLSMQRLLEFDHIVAFSKYEGSIQENSGFLRIIKRFHDRGAEMSQSFTQRVQHSGLSTSKITLNVTETETQMLKELNVLDSELYHFAKILQTMDDLYEQICLNFFLN